MGGLFFLGAIGLWLFLSFYLTLKTPKWLGLPRFGWVVWAA